MPQVHSFPTRRSSDLDLDGVVLVQVAFEDFLGQRVFQIALDRAAHWPGAVNRVVTLLDQEILCLLVELKLNVRSEEHTSELQSHSDLVCRLLLEKKKP